LDNTPDSLRSIMETGKRNISGNSLVAEKYQRLQTTRQVAWQAVAHRQQMNFKIYKNQSAAHEFKPAGYIEKQSR
jgi:hypothetical protein